MIVSPWRKFFMPEESNELNEATDMAVFMLLKIFPASIKNNFIK